MLKKPTWYSITNTAPRVASIALRGVIGFDRMWPDGAGTFKEFIEELNGLGELDEIRLSIHSPGGQVFEGLPIYNALKNHKARVVATVEGLAGSIASVILMAADERRIPRNAYVMIHNAEGIAIGDSRAVAKLAEDLAKFTGDIAKLYASRTGLDESRVTAMMDAETWMNGEDAVANGFADVLEEEVALSNLARFPVETIHAKARSKAPSAALAFFDISAPPNPKPETKPTNPPAMLTEAEMQAKIKEAEDKAAAAEAKAQAAEAAKVKAEADAAKADEEKKKAEEAAAKAKAEAESDKEKSDEEKKAVENRIAHLENLAKKGVLGASQGAPPVAGAGGDDAPSNNVKLSPLQMMAKARADKAAGAAGAGK